MTTDGVLRPHAGRLPVYLPYDGLPCISYIRASPKERTRFVEGGRVGNVMVRSRGRYAFGVFVVPA